jgi:hypothetical protein
VEDETQAGGEHEHEVIWPPNKIQQKVTLGGRISGPGFDAEVLRHAEDKAADLLAGFDDKLDDDVERILVAYDGMTRDPDSAAAAEMRGAAGPAASEARQAGLPLLADVCLSLANFLAIEGLSTETRLEVVKVHVDAVRLVYFRQVSGHGGEQGAELVRLITEATAQFRK